MSSLGDVIPVFSLAISGVAILITYLRNSKSDVEKMESRLVTLEQNIFCKEDRKCLQQLELKIGLFWSIVEKEFPKIIMSTHTPELDNLLRKATRGFKALDKQDFVALKDGINAEYEELLRNESNPGKALALALYRAAINHYDEENGGGAKK